MNSAIDVITWLGGNCCVPSACRNRPSTTMIRTKQVVISRIAGARLTTVSSSITCSVEARPCGTGPILRAADVRQAGATRRCDRVGLRERRHRRQQASTTCRRASASDQRLCAGGLTHVRHLRDRRRTRRSARRCRASIRGASLPRNPSGAGFVRRAGGRPGRIRRSSCLAIAAGRGRRGGRFRPGR